MSPYGFVLTWLVQGTLLGLVTLILPRVFRVTDPRQLVWWWSGGAMAVVCCPLLPLLTPAPTQPGSAAVTTFVESTTVALTSAVPSGAMPSPWMVLGTLWMLGVVARLAFLAVGRRRLAQVVAAANGVDDEALVQAHALMPPRGTRYPLASLPVTVLAADAATPCAFGWRHVHVMVPHALQQRPFSERVAVYLHELLHVARGDVHRMAGEEAIRLLCWWQPAVWWMLAQLRLAREHEVDAEVVARTGDTRGYVDALVWCSTLPPAISLGPQAGSRRHALVRRVALMCTSNGGDAMSRARRWTTNAGMTLVAGAVAATLGVVAPLRATAITTQDAAAQGEAGPLERTAVLPTLDAPAPRRVFNVEPVVHPSPYGFRFRVHLVLDAGGRVVEARIPETVPATVSAGELRRSWESGRAAVLEAVGQWQFEPPARSPMLIMTDVLVGSAALAAIPTAPPSMRAPSVGALRVGGTIGPPKKVVDVKPEYPQAAKDARVAGVVIVEATIDLEGNVEDARIVRSIPLLDQAALDAVKQWRYTPTLLNGEPVPVIMTLTINFTLQ